jgi:hypothetical protein
MAKLKRNGRVRWSAWLGVRLREASNNPIRSSFRDVHDAYKQLRKVTDYPGAMSVLRDALKDQGVRFSESHLADKNIVRNDHYVVILRGSACDIIDRYFESVKGGTTRQVRSEIIGNRWRRWRHWWMVQLRSLWSSLHSVQTPNDTSSPTAGKERLK